MGEMHCGQYLMSLLSQTIATNYCNKLFHSMNKCSKQTWIENNTDTKNENDIKEKKNNYKGVRVSYCCYEIWKSLQVCKIKVNSNIISEGNVCLNLHT